jgi:hypothetical protein
MGRRYDLLAKHFVNIGDRYQSDEKVIAFLRSRTVKIPFDTVRPLVVTA